MGTYVITGSASGIGAATRQRLESNGHEVVGVDLRDAEVIGDLSTESGRAEAVQATRALCGEAIDGLVPCAGVSIPASPEVTLAVNWFGSHAFLEGLHDLLAAHGSAKVVAVCSNSTTVSPTPPEDAVAALLAGDGETALQLVQETADPSAISYATSKTAIARWVRRTAVRDDWAGAGIRLNALAPGATLTPLLQAGIDDPVRGELIKQLPIPAGDFGTADQMAHWIEILLSPAADFMVGSIVFVDGGSDALIRPDAWPQTYSM